MNIQNVVDFNLASSDAERYRPDPAKVLKGDPEQAVLQSIRKPVRADGRRRVGRCGRAMDGELHRA
jgi:hypothetical protein